jgi:8-oxo-dGTP diphosphatase
VRRRACAVVIRDGKVLMCRHNEKGRVFWTLPGGGIEDGETPAAAAARELLEEANIAAEAVHLLTQTDREDYWLMRQTCSSDGSIGSDPELPASDQTIIDVAWLPLKELTQDKQIARLLPILRDHC